MKLVIIDYGLCNLKSVQNALRFIGVDSTVTQDSGELRDADAAILPGVGAFEDGMKGMRAHGQVEPVHDFVRTGRPFLGICLGMQMLMEKSYEFGEHRGLGLIPGEVISFKTEKVDEGYVLKVPHISWNSLQKADRPWQATPLAGLKEGDEMYFVHSFYVTPRYREDVLAETVYGLNRFCSVVARGNVYGTQFHPEKSSGKGLSILKEFVHLARQGVMV